MLISIAHALRGVPFAFQGKYGEAEPLYMKAVTISERAQGSEHPDLATWLTHRAWCLREQVRAIEIAGSSSSSHANIASSEPRWVFL